MDITYEIHQKIVKEFPDHPPEIGGILGARNNVVCNAVFDYGTQRQYIERIMRAMPHVKEKLYFPVVVLPERKMAAYVCRREKGKIEITETRIHLVRTMRL